MDFHAAGQVLAYAYLGAWIVGGLLWLLARMRPTPEKTPEEHARERSRQNRQLGTSLRWDSTARQSFEREAEAAAANHRFYPDVLRHTIPVPKKCPYCERSINGARETVVDHIVPLAKGGTSKMSNLCRVCVECNAKKSALTLNEFATIEGLGYGRIVRHLRASKKAVDVSCGQIQNAKAARLYGYRGKPMDLAEVDRLRAEQAGRDRAYRSGPGHMINLDN
jgi:5-methylcytosine-specific restriction endonuclease McrA